MYQLAGTYAHMACKAGVEIRPNTAVTPELVEAEAPDANVRHRPLLLKEIEKYVTVHTGCKGLEVRPDGILCETKDGEQILVPGTSVICALGQRSRIGDVEALRGTAPFVRIIGDAAKVSTITNAVYWGYHAALDIGTGC